MSGLPLGALYIYGYFITSYAYNRETFFPAITGNQRLRLAYVMDEVECTTNTQQSLPQAVSKLHQKPMQ
jgi:hypothetical protein